MEKADSEGVKVIEITVWFFAIATPKSREIGNANNAMAFGCMAKMMITVKLANF